MPFNVQHCAKLFGTITAGGAGTTLAINKAEKNGSLSKSHQERDTWMQMSCDGSFWPRSRSMSENCDMIGNEGRQGSVSKLRK